MRRGRIIFTGSGWHFFFATIFLFIGTLLTFGLLAPYWFFWSVKFFISHTEFELPEAARSIPVPRPKPTLGTGDYGRSPEPQAGGSREYGRSRNPESGGSQPNAFGNLQAGSRNRNPQPDDGTRRFSTGQIDKARMLAEGKKLPDEGLRREDLRPFNLSGDLVDGLKRKGSEKSLRTSNSNERK